MERRYDFVVIGAGPAGAIAAALLARGGSTVLIADAGNGGFRAGEHLAVEGRLALERLGILTPRWADRHLAIPGFINGWGLGEAVETSSLQDARAIPLALDRSVLEDQLRGAALRSGAKLLRGTRGQVQRGEDGRRWRVDLGTLAAVEADFLILATGRNSPLPLGISSRRRYDRLAYLCCSVSCSSGDLRPAVECFDRGWVYSVTAPGGRLLIYIFFEAAHGRPCARTMRSLRQLLRSCPYASQRLDHGLKRGAEIVWYGGAAHSSLAYPALGDDWLLLGDAAESRDPLSSSGLALAAGRAAELSAALLAGRLGQRQRHAFEGRRLAAFETYLQTRAAYYAAERRWPDSPFWSAAAAGFRSGLGAPPRSRFRHRLNRL